MIEIELWAGSGFVAVVDIPPFPHAQLPEVVTWGVRSFARVNATTGNWTEADRRPRYVEVFSVAILTPPPGRSLKGVHT